MAWDCIPEMGICHLMVRRICGGEEPGLRQQGGDLRSRFSARLKPCRFRTLSKWRAFLNQPEGRNVLAQHANSVPKAQDECSPARSAGFQVAEREVPEGRLVTTVTIRRVQFVDRWAHRLHAESAWATPTRTISTTLCSAQRSGRSSIPKFASDSILTSAVPRTRTSAVRSKFDQSGWIEIDSRRNSSEII